MSSTTPMTSHSAFRYNGEGHALADRIGAEILIGERPVDDHHRIRRGHVAFGEEPADPQAKAQSREIAGRDRAMQGLHSGVDSTDREPAVL